MSKTVDELNEEYNNTHLFSCNYCGAQFGTINEVIDHEEECEED